MSVPNTHGLAARTGKSQVPFYSEMSLYCALFVIMYVKTSVTVKSCQSAVHISDVNECMIVEKVENFHSLIFGYGWRGTRKTWLWRGLTVLGNLYGLSRSKLQ